MGVRSVTGSVPPGKQEEYKSAPFGKTACPARSLANSANNFLTISAFVIS
jgi:hypothetical protein